MHTHGAALEAGRRHTYLAYLAYLMVLKEEGLHKKTHNPSTVSTVSTTYREGGDENLDIIAENKDEK